MFSRKMNSKLSTSSQKVLLVLFFSKNLYWNFQKKMRIFNHFFKKENTQNVHGIPPGNGLFKVQIQLRRNKINELFTTFFHFSLKKNLFQSKLFLRRKTPIATKVQT